MKKDNCDKSADVFEALRKLKLLYKFNMRLGLKRAVAGLSYPRCFEYAWMLRRINDKHPKKILDLGPWTSPFPLFMASLGHEVTVIDLPEGLEHQRRYLKRKVVRGISASPPITLQEGKLPILTAEDGEYDMVTAVSTIEHLPNDGDIMVLRECARVLKPGGEVLITVPCRAAYEEGTFGKWFERRYDAKALQDRLVKATGLKLVEEFHIYDDRAAEFAGGYWKKPDILRKLMGWTDYFHARRIIEEQKPPMNPDSGGCLCLRK